MRLVILLNGEAWEARDIKLIRIDTAFTAEL